MAKNELQDSEVGDGTTSVVIIAAELRLGGREREVQKRGEKGSPLVSPG